MQAQLKTDKRFAIFAWVVLVYNLLVILWGTFVRATGSGAGCGGHWPLCNGEVVPLAPQLATVIEFTHRMTSGLSVLLVALLVIWAFRVFGKGHPVRFGAVASVVFIFTEALIGAALVLFGWVATNVSVARTVSISAHLINTFFLLSMLTLTAWWASGGAPLRLRGQGARKWMLALALLGVMVIGVTGAITALGDTLFPAQSLSSGLQEDVSATANFLIRLRVVHPLLAITVGVYLLFIVSFLTDPRHHLERILRALVLIQLGAGAINVVLLAPIWLQLVHLLLADLVWITLILFSASILATDLTRPLGRDLGAPAQLSTPAE
jgi:heme A synthase